MLITELDTFLHKICQLWNTCLNAPPNLDCHGSEAYVGRRRQLGHAPGPQVDPFHHHKRSFTPSYQQRRAQQRAAAGSCQ